MTALLLAAQLAAPSGQLLASAPDRSASAPVRAASVPGGLPDIATLEAAGTGGAWANDVVVKGTTAYLFENNKLIILDVQNPAAPEWLGEYRFERRPEGSFFHFDVADSHVYLPTAPNGMQIIDVSNPRQPNLCGSYTELPYIWDVKVIDSIAYLAAEDFQILDVHDPCNPQLLGSDPQWASKVVVSGGRAYLETQFDGITIMDVTNPVAPVKLSTYAGGGVDLAVVGTRLYIASDSLLIVDASNPMAPRLLNKYQALGGVLSIDVVGSLAYMSVSGMLAIINLADPAAPILLGSYAPLNESFGIQVSGSFVYVAASLDDLQIIDASNPAAPRRYGSYTTVKYPGRVRVEGSLAYVGGAQNLDILDVSDLHNPKIIGTYRTASGVGDLELVGSLAYLAGGMNLEIADIHDPARPTLVGRYSVPRNAIGFSSTITHVEVVGPHAYVSLKGDSWEDVRQHGTSGLLVLDVSNPAVPALIGSYITDAPANDVQVEGQYAYLAVGHAEEYYPGGLVTLDIADPSHPTLVGSYLMTADANDLQVVGNIVYMLDAYKGLNVLDISDPAHPRRIGLFTKTLRYPPIMALQVDGPVAYLMADDIEVLNVSDPTRPTLHSAFPVQLRVMDMQMIGDHLYTVNSEELSVYHIERDQASAEIAPSGGSLVNQIKTIEMTVPPDAVGTTAVVSYTGFFVQTQPLTEDQRIVRSFAIDAGQQSTVQLADFAQPYTIELRYNQLQLSAALAQESTLGVAARDGDTWTELPVTSYSVDTANDRVTLTGTQAREYALVGRSAHTFLPLMSR